MERARVLNTGLTVEEAELLTNANRTPIETAVEVCLEQKSGKAKKTIAQHRLTLNEFIEALDGKARFLDEITEKNLSRSQKARCLLHAEIARIANYTPTGFLGCSTEGSMEKRPA
jgi:hypothetical protein